jgi:DNA invertase Pin-like site-specific DNA recombinase
MDSRLRGKRIALYARYSSDRQRETSIDDQVRRCREYIEREGGVLADDTVFTDYAVSGSSLARAGFEALMRLVTAKPPAVDVIVTEDVSRVTRDLADGAQLFKRLQFAGVSLIGVGDGIDTGAKNAKVTFSIKNLVADLYLDDLRDKTLRGLEGRHLAGFSTGNPPYGYKSVPVTGPDGREAGRRLEVDEHKAATVRRIFALYLDGRSYDGIAQLLAKEGVPPPRAHTKHRRRGWVHSSIRAMLHNEKYVGEWRYKERQWLKVPGENRRLPRRRSPEEVMVRCCPDLRIIDDETWKAVQARLAGVHAKYTRNSDGTPKGRAAPGRMNSYLLSGILHCGVCGAPMIINGGGATRYYRCADYAHRRTCSNGLGVRETIARQCILDAIRARLTSPEGIAHARKRVAERLGELGREHTAELQERRSRLARTEARIAGLVQFIADGDRSQAVVAGLHDLEAQAKTEREAITAIERQAQLPIRLPSPDDIMKVAFDLNTRLTRDPAAGREWLRRILKSKKLMLEPLPEKVYLAKGDLLPLLLVSSERSAPPLQRRGRNR